MRHVDIYEDLPQSGRANKTVKKLQNGQTEELIRLQGWKSMCGSRKGWGGPDPPPPRKLTFIKFTQ